MSLETRSNSALMKRAEQLKRWQDSETFREPGDLKRKKRRIGFSDGCVFLAACAAGDKEEVKNLISRGTDIDTANVDGLTALHQVKISSQAALKDQGQLTSGLTIENTRKAIPVLRDEVTYLSQMSSECPMTISVIEISQDSG